MIEKRTYTKDTPKKIGEKVKLQGFVANVRNHGQLIFIDFRDWYGVVQIVINKENSAEIFKLAEEISREYVIEVEGTVTKRDARLVNKNIPTGEIEIVCENLIIVNKCETPPFPVEGDGTDIDESLKIKI